MPKRTTITVMMTAVPIEFTYQVVSLVLTKALTNAPRWNWSRSSPGWAMTLSSVRNDVTSAQ